MSSRTQTRRLNHLRTSKIYLTTVALKKTKQQKQSLNLCMFWRQRRCRNVTFFEQFYQSTRGMKNQRTFEGAEKWSNDQARKEKHVDFYQVNWNSLREKNWMSLVMHCHNLAFYSRLEAKKTRQISGVFACATFVDVQKKSLQHSHSKDFHLMRCFSMDCHVWRETTCPITEIELL